MKAKDKKEKDRFKELTNSVSNPPAQIDTLCEASNQPAAVARAVLDQVEHIRAFDLNVHIFAKTMLLGGLRVSEMLAVTPRDIDALGRVMIKSLKGGNPRLCDTGEHSNQFLLWRQHGYIPWRTWDRFFVYRQFKKYGIQIDIEGNKKQSVTHALRHISAQVSATVDSSLEATKGLLGHKSVTNTEIYAKSKSAKLLDSERKARGGKTPKSNRDDSEK